MLFVYDCLAYQNSPFTFIYFCGFFSILQQDTALERIKMVLKWYLSGFYKKPKGLKKPYNPIIGEKFRCYWQHPGNNSKTFYIAEQVLETTYFTS